MINSIDTLLTAEDSDTVIARAKAKRLQAEFDRYEVEKDNAKAATDSPSYEHTLAETQGRVDGLTATINLMPDGPGKDGLKLDLKKYEIRLASLLNKQGNYGQQSMLDQQCDCISLGGTLTSIDSYIALVEARKAAL